MKKNEICILYACEKPTIYFNEIELLSFENYVKPEMGMITYEVEQETINQQMIDFLTQQGYKVEKP